MIKLLKKNVRGDVLGLGFLVSLMLSSVLSISYETLEDPILSSGTIHFFRWIIFFVLLFAVSVILATYENVLENHKSTIANKDKEIDYLKNLLLEKEEKA